jgi:hypothetical protein
MKVSFALAILILPFFAFSQKNSAPETKVINKWRKAVFNIEVKKAFSDSTPSKAYIEYILALRDAHKIDSITADSAIINYKKDAFTGSVVFLEYKGKYYLVTARHVLKITDSTDAIQGLITIVRVPMEGESTSDNMDNDSAYFALSYSPNAPLSEHFIFSEISKDLAVISLNGEYSDYAHYLKSKGHIPVHITDLDTSGTLDYGQSLLCLGYPYFAKESEFYIKGLSRLVRSTSSFNIAATFGKVAIPSTNQYKFLGDISVMPGNSGGAII